MTAKLVSTLVALVIAYLLSTGPVIALHPGGRNPSLLFFYSYIKPVDALIRIPVAGPLLDRYITWWQPPELSNAPLSYPSGPLPPLPLIP